MAAASGQAPGPLAGIFILDLTTVVAGPMVGQILADMGADIIKVETVDYPGDSYRNAGSFKIKRMEGGGKEGMGGCYYTVNRGKRCICLNIKDPRGKEIFNKLLKKTDVMILNMRPAAAVRLGIGYEQVCEIKPDIIYCASNGWGTSGPLVTAKAYDPLIQATAGVVAAQNRKAKHGGPEVKLVNNIVMDKTCAMTTTQGILAALFARSQGKGGQRIDVSMLDAGVAFNWSDCFPDEVFVEQKEDYRAGEGIVPEFFGTAETSDGKWVVVVSTESDLFSKAFDRPDIAKLLGRPVTIREEMIKEVKKHTFEDTMARMKKWDMAAIQIPTTAQEVLAGPQVVHNKIVEVSDDKHFGKVRQARPAIKLSKTPLRIKGPAPLHGEHTAEVLKELGYSQADVDSLRQGKVISTGGGFGSKL